MERLSNEIYTSILTEELCVAMGCTEPIALAYAAAYARYALNKMPEKCIVKCSGNIIKNVKAVTVPQTNGMKGIEVAALAGAIVGDPSLKLEILSKLPESEIPRISENLSKVRVENLESDHALHIIIEMENGSDKVIVELMDMHTNITKVTRNDKVILERKATAYKEEETQREGMSIKDILEYGDTVNLDDIYEVLNRQIQFNSAISAEGLNNQWGARVGQNMLKADGESFIGKIKAKAAAGSDARMNGCAMPVVINSGSGNQGITVSIPVIEYAKHIGASEEKMLRALAIANLSAIHQKTSIGKLSAFCGVVSAATGAVVGMAYLDNQSYDCISKTIINSLANVGGMVCDGAKSSCAAKIVSALTSATLAYEMAKNDCAFLDGEGIVSTNVEEMILNMGQVASLGMKATDDEILKIMIK